MADSTSELLYPVTICGTTICDATVVEAVERPNDLVERPNDLVEKRYDILRNALLERFSAPACVAELCHLIQTGIRDNDLQVRYKYINLLFDRIWGKPVQPTAVQTTQLPPPPTVPSLVADPVIPGIRIEFVNAPADVKDVRLSKSGGRKSDSGGRKSDRKVFAQDATVGGFTDDRSYLGGLK
jgi:hypothetical protein